jgi:hypothetical protein
MNRPSDAAGQAAPRTYPVERSAVVPLPADEAWEAFFGREAQNWVDLSDVVTAVREYRMRADGTPEYVMENRMGPLRASHRSNYLVYEPPHRSVDETLDSPLGGRFHVEHQPVAGGTRIVHRWNVEPHGPMRLLFPLIRPMFERSFQRDLDVMVDRIAQRARNHHDPEGGT